MKYPALNLMSSVFNHFTGKSYAKQHHEKDVGSVASSNDKFSLELYDLLKNKEGNLLMSPFSVSAVMAMVSAGAKGNTLTQIRKGLSFPTPSSLQLGYQDTLPALKSTDNFTLETANAVFVQKSFSVLPSFRDILKKFFHTSFESVNFRNVQSAAKQINTWVKAVTRRKIKDLITPNMLDSNTRLVLVNAIYFKGDWAYKFNPHLTTDKDFYVSPSTTALVPMMTQVKELQWANLATLSSIMVELPYKGDRIVMQVLIPLERNGLRELEEKLKNQNIQDLFEKGSSKTSVHIKLPKFKLEKKIDLKQILTDLGMPDMFSDLADFSGINGKKGLSVSEVVQKAFIEVNEEGSEAAAATGAVMIGRSAGPMPVQFIADHPFIFYIRDKTTGMLLFQGRMVNPEK